MNTIEKSAIIKPFVNIGDNNYIDDLCIIGGNPTHIKLSDRDKLKGVTIGNNNYFYASTHVIRGINENTIIGNECIFGQTVIIGHDSIIKNRCKIMNGCRINGHVTIGKETFLGTGTVVRNRINIGENCYVGQMSNIVKDIPDNCFGYGHPFKIINQHDADLIFILKKIRSGFNDILGGGYI